MPFTTSCPGSGCPLSPHSAPPPRPPNFPTEVCARPGPGRSSARPPDRRREGRRKDGDRRIQPGSERGRERANQRAQGPQRGLTMARGEAWTREGRRPSGPAAPHGRQDPSWVRVLPARRPGASYLCGRADGLRLRVPAVGGQRGAGEGEGRGGRGPGREAHGARAPLARPPGARPLRHICSSGQGRWPRRPGRAGMSLRGREERGGGREREEGPSAVEEGEEEGRGGRPPSLATHSLPPSLQTPLATAAPGPGRQLPGGACASGGGGGRLGRGRGGRADSSGSGHREGGREPRRGPGSRPPRPPPRPPRSRPRPEGSARTRPGGGLWGRRGAGETRYPAPGEAWERGGRAGLEEKPQGPRSWRRRLRQRGGDPRLLQWGHLGQGPAALGSREGARNASLRLP